MRILHTSDWHLGQHFFGKSRTREHRLFTQWLIALVVARAVDAVIIAGDVFDTGTPPSHARETYHAFALALHDAGVTLVVVAGNHDSAAMLGESRALLERLGAHIVPAVSSTLPDQLVRLDTRDGRPGAWLCAIPYIRPQDVLCSRAGESAEEKGLRLRTAIRDHYAELFALARAEAAGLPLPIIATGHLTTAGAQSGESVRELYIGTLEAFPAADFPPADYIALGHIHRPQKIGGTEHIRYCGAPLALGFDEAAVRREVLLVDFAQGQRQAIEAVAVPCFQPLLRIDTDLDELPQNLARLAVQSTPDCPAWLEITIRDGHHLADLHQRIQEMLENLPFEVLRIRRARASLSSVVGAAAGRAAAVAPTLAELSPAEVFDARLRQEALSPDVVDQLRQRYQAICASLHEPAA